MYHITLTYRVNRTNPNPLYMRHTIYLLACAIMLAQTHCIEQCSPPPNPNFRQLPPFWCKITASVTIGSSACLSQVEEQIVIPWSIGSLTRHIPKQGNQQIDDFKAFVNSSDTETEVHTEAMPDDTGTNAVYNIRISATKQPVSFVLRYKILGVLSYTHCADIMDFPSVTPPPGSSPMISKWSIGGLSTKEVNTVQVEFRLVNDSRFSYLDSGVKHPNDVTVTTTQSTIDQTIQMATIHSVTLTNLNPAHFVFYFRFTLVNGWAYCPNVRSCSAEAKQLEEEYDPALPIKLIIGVTVGVALVILIVALIIWAYCHIVGKARREAETMQANLPNSLRHFAYDTGDTESSGKWKEWMEAAPSQEKEQICAIDLSPRNQAQ